MLQTAKFSFLITLTVAFFASVYSKDWMHSVVLDSKGHYRVYWSYDVKTIEFRVVVKTLGYVGFGLSKTGAMAGSDIVTGWVADGDAYFQDRHGEGNFRPVIDKSQDWELTSGFENDTHTVLQFRRNLRTCDTEDMEIDESTMRLICAWSDEDPPDQDPNKISYHGKNTGVRSVMLLQPQNRKILSNDGLPFWDILSRNFSIDSSITSIYWCSISKGPVLNEKHHVVKVEPVIQPGHEGYVHHIVLWECVSGSAETLEEFVEHEGHECYHPNMPDAMQKCAGMLAAWGVGGESLVFPEHVGIPLQSSPPKYYQLEVHYDNPSNDKVIRDRSGLRLYYTPKLREYEAGTLMIGAAVSPRVVIPPKREKYVVSGHGHPECFKSVMPSTGVNLLGIFLHAHLLGRQLLARHFRNNEELLPLANNSNYDFNYQEYIYFQEDVKFLPGDQITMECGYNSMDRNSATYGGLRTREEMCLAFILYYPRFERYGAVSVASGSVLYDAIGKEGDNSPFTREGYRTFYSTFSTVDWSVVNIEKMENSTMFSEHDAYCYIGNQTAKLDSSISYPENLEIYKAKPRSCEQPLISRTAFNKGDEFLIIFMWLFHLL